MTRAPNSFEARHNRNAIIELLGFEQTVMRVIKVIAFDITSWPAPGSDGRSSSGCLCDASDFTHPFPQRDRSGLRSSAVFRRFIARSANRT
jgi:hypothetical protein